MREHEPVDTVDERRADGAWLRPSPDLLRMRLVELAGITLGVAAIAGVIVGLAAGAGWGAVAAGVAVIGGLVAAPFLTRRIRSWGYAEREDDLLVRHGILVARLSVVPYGRMQFIDVEAGPIERLFGLSTLHLHTAAAATDARIPGLDATEAARLRDQLASLGESRLAGL
jgi:membrane protein YdbS with pleckstrin-like domain